MDFGISSYLIDVCVCVCVFFFFVDIFAELELKQVVPDIVKKKNKIKNKYLVGAKDRDYICVMTWPTLYINYI